jgi:hypothetical protein
MLSNALTAREPPEILSFSLSPFIFSHSFSITLQTLHQTYAIHLQIQVKPPQYPLSRAKIDP